MANSAGITYAFKADVLKGTHNLNSHSLKMALYASSASIGPTTAAYTATGEASGTGYTAGGAAVTNGTVSDGSGSTAYWTPSASVSWTTVTFSSVDCALLYNTTASNATIASFTFSSTSVTAGNFTLTMPTNDASTGLIRLA